MTPINIDSPASAANLMRGQICQWWILIQQLGNQIKDKMERIYMCKWCQNICQQHSQSNQAQSSPGFITLIWLLQMDQPIFKLTQCILKLTPGNDKLLLTFPSRPNNKHSCLLWRLGKGSYHNKQFQMLQDGWIQHMCLQLVSNLWVKMATVGCY